MQAAHTLKVHLGWMVAFYDLGEALANLVQPFWMLPVLGVLGLKARDIMGYTFVVFLVLAPVVLLLVGLLGRNLPVPAVARPGRAVRSRPTVGRPRESATTGKWSEASIAAGTRTTSQRKQSSRLGLRHEHVVEPHVGVRVGNVQPGSPGCLRRKPST